MSAYGPFTMMDGWDDNDTADVVDRSPVPCSCEWERAELQAYAALSGPDSQAQTDLNTFRCPHQASASGEQEAQR